jgi:radical SAM superfamily enzyme YgiQ (UPF0313 family)
MKRKVLLLNLPFPRRVIRDYGCPHGAKAQYLWPPIDLLLVGAVLGNEASLSYLDAIAGDLSAESVVAEIHRIRPDAIVVILSSITLESDIRILSEIRHRCPDIRIWASGDVVFFGERDLPEIDYLIRDLTNRRDLLDLWRNDPGGGIVQKTIDAEFSIGICPHELTRPYAYAMPYSLYSGITSVLTNYGCPFPCTFCNSNKLGFKRRSVREVVEELLIIHRLGVKEILFRDFAFNMSDADLLCDEMIRNHIHLKWSCWTPATLVNRDILRKMKEAGCYLISYGVESGDRNVLGSVRKPGSPEQIKEAVDLTKAAGIEVQTSFIIGFPGEDRAKTLSFIKGIDPDYLSLNILAPRLGTAISHELLQAGMSDQTDSLLSSDGTLVAVRDAAEKRFFLRPRKLLRYLLLSLKSPFRLLIFIRTGTSLLRRWTRTSADGS